MTTARNESRTVTRKELYDLVWSTPMRRLAPDFGLSDVGLAKVCERYSVPRPPVGYWAKLEHGKPVKKTPLPKCPEECPEVVEFVERPVMEKQEYQFFDADLASKYIKVCAGEGVAAVRDTLRGCHEVVKRTREFLDFKPREARNKWGGYVERERYEGSHLSVTTQREHRRRALCMLDAAVKTVVALGAEVIEPTDRWNRTVTFKLRTFEFGLCITERERQQQHELTAQEKSDQKQYGTSFAPKYDMVPTGKLRLRLTYPGNCTALIQYQDGKKKRIEDAIGNLAQEVVLRADRSLRREAERIEEQKRSFDLAMKRREEEERRRAEQASRDQLFELSGLWHKKARLDAFVQECKRRVEAEDLGDEEADLMRRWLAWAEDVAVRLDPFAGELVSLPHRTHGENVQ